LLSLGAKYFVFQFAILKFKDQDIQNYEGWDFNSGNYLFTTDTK